ncbi:BofC C-terminal domain-containing protein [Paenibacillaceae bacterium WGS1546]|uniref:BofC C-terminal domain-containing protein n=1 Tax=Cohnella sp. WGS1546 TaxID=3366810 RepID=UPI00372D6649
MSRFRIFKEIKKSLKRKRRHAWSLGIGVGVFLAASLTGVWMAHRIVAGSPEQAIASENSAPVWMDARIPGPDAPPREQTLLALRGRSGEVELVLHRTYLCGEEVRKLGRHSTAKAAELLQAHREWEATLDMAGNVRLEETIDDLSPLCRKTAYMGLDKDGNLSLFDGPPWKEKVIRTFFQLDVDMLESRWSEDKVRQLADGIRVSDGGEYHSVLSSLNEFANVRTQAKPRP